MWQLVYVFYRIVLYYLNAHSKLIWYVITVRRVSLL